MLIENHRLVGENVTFEFDEQGAALKPEIVVIHYAVTHDAKSTAAVLKARDYVSCHLTIDSTGRVIQQVPFNRVAFHAGKSVYRGRANVNAFSLGIEISNPGPLVTGPDGRLRTVYGKVWEAGHVQARHRDPNAPRVWQNWAEYSPTEVDLCAQLCELFRQVYGITDIVGHDDVSPGRKFDPGPAFPMAWLRGAVFPATAKVADAMAELTGLPTQPPSEIDPTEPGGES